MSKYILDTDKITLLRKRHPEVVRRVAAAPPGDVGTSVISVEEVLTGWYTVIRRANIPITIERAYSELAESVTFFAGMKIETFNLAAISIYDHLKALKLNVGGNDLRIAAIALEAGAIVVSRNVRDFGRVPGLVVEDWSVR